jgi:hypothetical protein
MMGFVDLYPAINNVSSATEHVIGKLAARNCWDYTNGSLLVAGTSLPHFHLLIGVPSR